eukprot:Lithocolla_globosa_v1_NODE_551_length_3760_cov_28.499055.p3 type:complete len:270 gc:universal NODE_551_length_3760_cov_28.499055:869-60(-)
MQKKQTPTQIVQLQWLRSPSSVARIVDAHTRRGRFVAYIRSSNSSRKLKYGMLSAKMEISCVMRDMKGAVYILPRLPEQLNFLIIIQTKDGKPIFSKGKKLKDLEIRKAVWVRALNLLINADHPSWNVATFKKENADRYPEHGYLDEVKGVDVQFMTTDEIDDEKGDKGDKGDHGPAEDQLMENDDVTYEGAEAQPDKENIKQKAQNAVTEALGKPVDLDLVEEYDTKKFDKIMKDALANQSDGDRVKIHRSDLESRVKDGSCLEVGDG